MKSLLRLVIFGAFLCAAMQAIAQEGPEPLEKFLHHVESMTIDGTSNGFESRELLDEEKAVVLELSEILSHEGVAAYYSRKKQIESQLLSRLRNYSWYWIERLDRTLIKQYLLGIAATWTGQAGPGPELYKKFLESTDNDGTELRWLETVYYGEDLHPSRGIFENENNRISIQIARPSEVSPILAHELTHRFDEDLWEARNRMEALYVEIRALPPNSESWSASERESFGHYWFLTEYENSYKELLPMSNACLVFTEAVRMQTFTDLGAEDLKKYESVLVGRETCQGLAFRENQRSHGEPKPFWKKEQWQGVMVEEYRTSWLKRHGFD